MRPLCFQDLDPFDQHRTSRPIAERENDYQARRRRMILSPSRHDPFAGGSTHNLSK